MDQVDEEIAAFVAHELVLAVRLLLLGLLSLGGGLLQALQLEVAHRLRSVRSIRRHRDGSEFRFLPLLEAGPLVVRIEDLVVNEAVGASIAGVEGVRGFAGAILRRLEELRAVVGLLRHWLEKVHAVDLHWSV